MSGSARCAQADPVSLAAALRSAQLQLPAAALAAISDPGKPARHAEAVKTLVGCLHAAKQLLPGEAFLDEKALKSLSAAVRAVREKSPSPKVSHPAISSSCAPSLQMILPFCGVMMRSFVG